jgi:superfamily II DNA or RNA helicase
MEDEKGRSNKITLLHEWQREAIRSWFDNGCRGIADVATGAGKTVFALAAADRLRQRYSADTLRVKIVAPRIFLARQWKKEASSYLGVAAGEIGLFCGEVKDDPARPFMIYVINSARYALARHVIADVASDHDVLLVCDEAHHMGSTENARVFDFLPEVPPGRVFTLGLSATPDAEHLDDVIAPALGPVIFRFGLGSAICNHIAANYRLFCVETPFSVDESAEYDTIEALIARAKYDLYRACPNFDPSGTVRELVNKLNRLIREGGKAGTAAARLKQLYFRRKRILLLTASRVPCGVALVRLLPPGSKTIVFAERIATANALYLELSTLYPNRIGRYHSKMEATVRELTLEDYRTGKTRVLICCRALDEGLNVPDTDVGIILSSSSGARQRIQRLGRILRKTPGDEVKRIFYVYVPNTAESPTLLPPNPPGAEGSGDRNRESDETGIVYDPGENGFRLIFDPRDKSIACPQYDAFAAAVIETLRAEGASEKQIENAVHFLKRGVVDPLWDSTPEEAKRRLAEAPTTEKNYRAAMLLLARTTAADT